MKKAKTSSNFVKVKSQLRRFIIENNKALLFALLFATVGYMMLAYSHAAVGNDLVVTGVSMTPASPAAGQAVTFSATVKNQGTTAVPAGTVIGVSFTLDGTKVSWNESNTAGLAAGASVTLSANAGSPAATWTATSGPHSLVALADDTNAIPDESDEANNSKRLDFTIGNTGKLYVSPASTSVLVNNNVVVNVRLTPGTNVDGVKVQLNFDPAKLQYVSADTTGNPFTQVLVSPNATNGVFTFQAGYLPPSGSSTTGISADSQLVAITFKALVGSGSDSLILTGNATKTGVYTNPALANGTVTLTAPDTTAPATSITSPAAGSNIVATAPIAAAASDAVGVTKVELYVDGVLKVTDTTSPYSFSVNTTTMANGNHTFQTKAYDAAGNVGTSTSVSLTVRNWPEDINQDGMVDLLDFSLLAAKFNQSGTGLGRADINGDSTVDLLDFSLLAAKFNQ